VRPSDEDVDYLLTAVNDFFGARLQVDDVAGAFAGVRPLISNADSKKSVDISRKAELYETSSGMVTITGGKLTTWRRMAKMTVDRLVEREAREAPCRTHEIPLGQAVSPAELPRTQGVTESSYAALAARYGHAAFDVLALCAREPELATRIVGGESDLLAEAAFAARHEQAGSVADVLLRRARLGVLAARELAIDSSPALGTSGPVGRVAETLAGTLGWDVARTRQETERFWQETRDEGLIASPGCTRAA
jgi:glycerol-3-phosphate dehydrogenase